MSLSELELMEKRMVADMISGKLSGFGACDQASVTDWRLLARMTAAEPDGTVYFTDLDYTDQTRSNWQPAKHLSRMYHIAVLYHRIAEPAEKTACGEFLCRLLDFWLKNDFICLNWWYNEIKVPMEMVSLMQLIGDLVSPESFQKACLIINRGSLCHGRTTKFKMTGANLLWNAMTTFRYGLLLRDDRVIRETVHIAAEEIAIGMPEGIQPDGSFFQHGRLLYSGGYGLSFAIQTATLMYYLRDTDYQFAADKMNILSVHLLDGIRRMMHCGTIDFAVTGREYTRPQQRDSFRTALLALLEQLSEIDSLPRHAEIAALLAEVRAEKPSALCGATYFPTAEFLCAHLGTVYVSFKGHASDLKGAEICNGEGVVGYHFSYGTHTTVMRSGREYDDIAPVWDYGRLPGVSSLHETDAQIAARPDWSGNCVNVLHHGGGSFGEKAICYEALGEGSGIYAVCFATARQVILLGTHIADSTYETTVQQAFSNGDCTVLPNGDVSENGIRYCNLDSSCKFIPTVQTQTGSWQRNSLSRENAPVSGEIFTLMLDRNGADHYAYAISEAETELPVRVLRNDTAVQAVALADGTVMAVFYEDASLVWQGKTVSGKADTCAVIA